MQTVTDVNASVFAHYWSKLETLQIYFSSPIISIISDLSSAVVVFLGNNGKLHVSRTTG